MDRLRAVVVAGHRGDTPTALAHLADADPEVRSAALGALARCGALGAEDLLRASTDPAPAVRRRVAQLAATHPWEAEPGSPAAERLLVGLLADPEWSVAEMAAWASGERSPTEPGAVGVLSEMATGHTDSLCREAAVAALGAIGDPAGLPAVLAALDDRATVRRRAVLALAPFEGPEVEAALRERLGDRDVQVRQAAEDLLEDWPS